MEGCPIGKTWWEKKKFNELFASMEAYQVLRDATDDCRSGHALRYDVFEDDVHKTIH